MVNENNIKFCANCGAEIDAKAAVCPNCGVIQTKLPQKPAAKNPWIALFLSFIFAGFGQLYNGEVSKGEMLVIIQVINVFLFFIFVGMITYTMVWIYAMVDAYSTARRMTEEASQ